jgi:hypothetical protein
MSALFGILVRFGILHLLILVFRRKTPTYISATKGNATPHSGIAFGVTMTIITMTIAKFTIILP